VHVIGEAKKKKIKTNSEKVRCALDIKGTVVKKRLNVEQWKKIERKVFPNNPTADMI